MSRVKYAAKNIAMGYVSTIATALLNFILRTIFIRMLGDALNGVSSLYTDVLSMLSLAELGIGTALNFSLYGPVARGETEHIKSYMRVYKWAYRIIALVIAVIGLALTPFLQYLIKDPGVLTIGELRLYYLIFLFNTVSTYFVAYKYSLVNAEQKNYIQTNINMISKVITIILQIIGLLIFKNFLIYLLTAAFVELAQKIFASIYLNRLYPFLKDKDAKPLPKEESAEIVRKTKALVLHKVGDTARLQTDSLIISSMIGVVVSGIVSNYTLVMSTVSNFVNVIFNSVISSFGNLIATEDKDKQFSVFKVYRFFAVWVYGFAAIGFYALLSPLVCLWLGEDHVLAALAVNLILVDYFFKGERIVLSNFKTAAGVFEQDRYLALIQGAVNLIVSILMVKLIGLPGVYVGTVISGLIANITKPIIIYKVCFDMKSGSYFKDSFKYILVMVLMVALVTPVKYIVTSDLHIWTFLLGTIVITVLFNGIFLLLFHKSAECRYVTDMVKRKLLNRRK